MPDGVQRVWLPPSRETNPLRVVFCHNGRIELFLGQDPELCEHLQLLSRDVPLLRTTDKLSLLDDGHLPAPYLQRGRNENAEGASAHNKVVVWLASREHGRLGALNNGRLGWRHRESIGTDVGPGPVGGLKAFDRVAWSSQARL